jgi:hypothetical protein
MRVRRTIVALFAAFVAVPSATHYRTMAYRSNRLAGLIPLALVSMLLVALTCAIPAGADDAVEVAAPDDDGPKVEPGGIDCHYVERIERQLAGPQCGWNDLLMPNAGNFRCGRVAVGNQCVDRCFFIECEAS